MSAPAWRDGDVAQITARGLTVGEVRRQIALFEAPPPFMRLERACVPGDGIRVLSDSEVDACLDAFEEAGAAGRLTKFTPASGAATRMFETLLAVSGEGTEVSRDEQTRRARDGDQRAREVLAFMEGIRRFAFFEELAAAMSRAGEDIEVDIAAGRFGKILTCLLSDQGLGYGWLPKGLVRFHRYPEGARTAFEEHLVDATAYARDGQGVCRAHFTVSPQYLAGFERALESARIVYERRTAASFQVGFSVQPPGTETVAVDLENRLFRDSGGRLLFRPGGHGALIENINALGADLIVIKNIDNVVPDHRKGPVICWTKILAGCLARLQRRIFECLATLTAAEPPAAAIETARRFVREELLIAPPPAVAADGLEAVRDFLLAKLHRPVRVCGMVRAESNPGGGPFWVRGPDGVVAPQIVETAQVDGGAADQQAIVAASTHFNPVDLVCGLRDRRGTPYDLRRYVDRAAVFITGKSSEGRALKALEHPGLWNGGMSDWNTVFVEVPAATFTPVKTVNDLLRPEHSPPD